MTLEEQIQQASLGSDVERLIKVNIGNQELTFKSEQELSAELEKALSTVNSEVMKLRQQNAELENLKNQQVQQQRSTQYAESDSDINNKFDMDYFVETIKKDPVKAIDYVDEFRKPKNEAQLADLMAMKQEYEAQKFIQSHPEFPGGDHGNKLEQIRQELNLPFTKIGLEAAYAHGIQQNVFPDFKVQAALNQQQQLFNQWLQQQGYQVPGQTQTNVVQQQPYIQSSQYVQGIPAVPSGGGQAAQTTINQLENMTLEQMEKLLKQNGML